MNFKQAPLRAGLALACLAGTTHAQTTVNLYGLIDLNVGHYKAGASAGGGGKWQMMDGVYNGLNGSRWGIRASEDLGGGLKVHAVLEGGFAGDTGVLAQGGRGFGRQVYVGLASNEMGELRLGRQYILSDYVMVLTDPMGNALVSNPSTVITTKQGTLPLWLNAPRADNLLQYKTPATLGGWFGAVQLAPGEGTADRYHGVSSGYLSNTFSASFAYEWNKSRTTGQDTNKSLTLGANYNFGSFKILGGYQSNRNIALGSGNGSASYLGNLVVSTGGSSFTMNRNTGVTVGVEVPLGPFTVGANHTLVKYEGAAGGSADFAKTALVGRYALSKTTFVYTGVSFASGDLADHILEKQVVNLGLRFSF